MLMNIDGKTISTSNLMQFVKAFSNSPAPKQNINRQNYWQQWCMMRASMRRMSVNLNIHRSACPPQMESHFPRRTHIRAMMSAVACNLSPWQFSVHQFLGTFWSNIARASRYGYLFRRIWSIWLNWKYRATRIAGMTIDGIDINRKNNTTTICVSFGNGLINYQCNTYNHQLDCFI